MPGFQVNSFQQSTPMKPLAEQYHNINHSETPVRSQYSMSLQNLDDCENIPNWANDIRGSLAVSHSELPPNFEMEYKNLDDLPFIKQDIDLSAFLNYLHQKLTTGKWTDIFEALNELRSLYKSVKEMTNQILEGFLPILNNIIKTSKSCVIKLCFIALTDIYRNCTQHPIETRHTIQVLQLLIQKNSTSKTLYKTDMVDCFQAIVQNSLNDEILRKLCEWVGISNKVLSTQSFQYLAQILNYWEQNIINFEDSTNKSIVCVACNMFQNPHEGDSKSTAKQILKFYLRNMGESAFQGCLTNLYEENFLKACDVESIWRNVSKPETPVFPRVSNMIQEEIRKSRQFGY